MLDEKLQQNLKGSRPNSFVKIENQFELIVDSALPHPIKKELNST